MTAQRPAAPRPDPRLVELVRALARQAAEADYRQLLAHHHHDEGEEDEAGGDLRAVFD